MAASKLHLSVDVQFGSLLFNDFQGFGYLVDVGMRCGSLGGEGEHGCLGLGLQEGFAGLGGLNGDFGQLFNGGFGDGGTVGEDHQAVLSPHFLSGKSMTKQDEAEETPGAVLMIVNPATRTLPVALSAPATIASASLLRTIMAPHFKGVLDLGG